MEAPRPITGNDLAGLRSELGTAVGRRLTLMDFPYELGVHRARYTEMVRRGNDPILKPRLEILTRLLQRYPHWAIAAEEERLVSNAMELMNHVRPSANYTMRDLAIMLGYEVTASLPWAYGKKTIPTTNRILRIIVRGLRQEHEKDRELFFRELESVVASVAAAYEVPWEKLQSSGFSGFREKRRAWAPSEAGDDGAPRPMTGNDLAALRDTLGDTLGRRLTLMDFPFELGVHRARYTEMVKRADSPIMKPRLEILARLLKLHPFWAIAAEEERLVSNALELMNHVRPSVNYTMRELAIMLGYEVTASLPWAAGKKTIPTTNRILRLIVRGLRQEHEKDRELFFRSLESIVSTVAESYQVSSEDLQTSGFAGFRARRREWGQDDPDEADDEELLEVAECGDAK